MNIHIKNAFQKSYIRPESVTVSIVWNSVVRRQKKYSRLTLYMNSFVTVVSFIALFPIASNLVARFTESGFYQYASLIFSDGSILSTYWKELTLSIIDALPFTSIMILCVVLLIFFVSIRQLVSTIRTPLPVTA